MAFCPNCEAEYKAGITVCSDCGIALVEELTAETKLHDTAEADPVVFQSFKTSAEARLVSELLKENGIRVFVEGGEFAPFPGSFARDIVVMVDERDLPRAVELYEAYFNVQPAPDDSTDAAG